MDIGFRILSFLQVCLDYLVRPLYKWIERTPPKRIPYNDNPLLNISATKLAKKIRDKEIKSETMVRAYLERIKEVNDVLNAVVENRFSTALYEARRMDENIAKGTVTAEELKREKPLYGVPITIKESCAVQGMLHTVGRIARRSLRAPADGEVVARLRAAGAIPIAVTNTPEYCLSWDTVNLITGRTVNPYNTHRTSGGSSGGEGALIGAGASIAGIGSDIAGSIRVPAHFNGIFGHKPTGGIVSIKGHYPQSTDKMFPIYLVLGPMTRYAEDLLTMMKIIAGDNAKKLNLDTKVDISSLNVYYMESATTNSMTVIPVQDKIKEAVRKSVTYLQENCKANICETKFTELEESLEMSVAVLFSSMKDIPNILRDQYNPKRNYNLFLELIKSMVGLSEVSANGLLFHILKETNAFVPRSKNPYYVKKFEEFQKKFEEELGENGIFLYPTFPTGAFNHYGVFTRTTGVMYTMIFNVLEFPSTHVPIEFDSDGLPIGIQVVAGRNQDRLCLAVAQELENAFGGWVPPPCDKPQ